MMNVPAPALPASRVERFIGRSLAACLHPVAAWHRRSTFIRVQVIAGYLLASYLVVLTILLLLAPSSNS
jgi:hypothetical protein